MVCFFTLILFRRLNPIDKKLVMRQTEAAQRKITDISMINKIMVMGIFIIFLLSDNFDELVSKIRNP